MDFGGDEKNIYSRSLHRYSIIEAGGWMGAGEGKKREEEEEKNE